MQNRMSETVDVDHRGRFLPGNKRSTGRPKGARDRHTRNFLEAMSNDFETHGAAVIAKVREEKPEIWLRIAADLLPKQAILDVDVSVMHDVSSVVEAFRVASDLLGTDPRAGLKRLKNVSPMIEHDDER
jgi:hypothetical protein